MVQALWLQNFISVYSDLGVGNLTSLQQVYHREIEFSDPLHRVDGLDELMNYFDSLYTHIEECTFHIDSVFSCDNQAAIYWTMMFCHPKLNGGKQIVVEGHSHLVERDNKVVMHRDYLDVGSMLYEHIPLLGKAVKAVKKRAIR
ncbi:nuclear transport factor 2 family protein [Shewanella sp. UCD-KL12]|uniref:nuclear transport factor 2 family protein n=1 Tax=Shewanella sp. UCD-KL12 TaxID=1917163 RepID=UPI000970F39E|nr:nuclear transport factor 2 family protein [Shewanella sp. UCD-KL12]